MLNVEVKADIQYSLQHSSLSIQHCMFNSIAIVGFGLIGGSVGLAVREVWPSCRIVAIDRAAVADAAVARRQLTRAGTT